MTVLIKMTIFRTTTLILNKVGVLWQHAEELYVYLCFMHDNTKKYYSAFSPFSSLFREMHCYSIIQILKNHECYQRSILQTGNYSHRRNPDRWLIINWHKCFLESHCCQMQCLGSHEVLAYSVSYYEFETDFQRGIVPVNWPLYALNSFNSTLS